MLHHCFLFDSLDVVINLIDICSGVTPVVMHFSSKKDRDVAWVGAWPKTGRTLAKTEGVVVTTDLQTR